MTALAVHFTHCLGLYPAISSQFTLEVCTAAENHTKTQKYLFKGFRVIRGHRC